MADLQVMSPLSSFAIQPSALGSRRWLDATFANAAVSLLRKTDILL